jgi:hypothetical protein
MNAVAPLYPPPLVRAIAHVPVEIPDEIPVLHYYALSIPVDRILPYMNVDYIEDEFPRLLRDYHGAGHFMSLDNSMRIVGGEPLPKVFIDDRNVWIRLYYNERTFDVLLSDEMRNECNNLHNGAVSDLRVPVGEGFVIGGIQKCSIEDMREAFFDGLERGEVPPRW